jgi:hypothetical protein
VVVLGVLNGNQSIQDKTQIQKGGQVFVQLTLDDNKLFEWYNGDMEASSAASSLSVTHLLWNRPG